MSLYDPYFYLRREGGEIFACHNCSGGLGFCATEKITGETGRLIELAVEEGMRRKAKEIREALLMRG